MEIFFDFIHVKEIEICISQQFQYYNTKIKNFGNINYVVYVSLHFLFLPAGSIEIYYFYERISPNSCILCEMLANLIKLF